MTRRSLFSSILLFTLLLTLSGCGHSLKVTLTPEQETAFSAQVDAAQTILDGTSNPQDRLKAYEDLGKAYQALGKADDALKAYEGAILLYNYDAIALHNSALIYEELENYDKAGRFMTVLYTQAKDDRSVVGDLIRVLSKAGDTDTALKVLEAYAMNHPKPDSETTHWISDTYVSIGNYKNAAKDETSQKAVPSAGAAPQTTPAQK